MSSTVLAVPGDHDLVTLVHEQTRLIDNSTWCRMGTAEQRSRVAQLVRVVAPLLADDAIGPTVSRVLARIGGLGPLEPLLGDPGITEVMVNGGGDVWVERSGRIEATGLVVDETLVLQMIERIVAPLGLRIDRSSPVVDARLADGSRVNAIVRPVAVDGPCLTIRRFGVSRIPIEAFGSPGIVALLRWAVKSRANLLISGGTGSGKTTLLNAIASAIAPHERLITIEDTAELALPADHVVRLEGRPANADGAGELRIRDLVRNALRMRPDRLIVGEVRGDEALDMLQAMNTGHEGSMSTCHANSPGDALRRIETMILMGSVDLPLAAVRQQIAASIDLVVHVARSPAGGRRIAEIHEVDPHADLDSGWSTIPLTDSGLLASLPRRPARSRSAPCAPSPEWIER